MFVTTLLVLSGAALMDHFGLLTKEMTGRVPLLYFGIVSLMIGTILAFMFSSKPLKPLREIMIATDKIADGDYSVRINLKGPAEFRQLSDKFNHMAEEIEGVEMLRSDFVGNFSHEFKTPIVSIRGFAKALKWEDLTDEERNEYLDIIINESERLSDLSANVLYLSKIEKQAILTDKSTFNVSEQIRLVVALLDKKISNKHLNILFDSKEFYIEGNEEMLKQVWINLLDNAIKFSPENGDIEIRIKQNESQLSVKITNEGEEIGPEAKAHIFDKFYQGDTSHSTAGNGLGLAIVKKILDLHEGKVSVLSSDKSSTFEVKLNNK
ncbi:MAG: HAMP domain-containing histidine kinase [Lachnospiraceae bacterium]|nr:HAMP domain-containing histidine kinase [Lachnospiraceae bacterium]